MSHKVVRPSAGHAHGGPTAAGVVAMTHLWIAWAEVAIDRERAARLARGEAVALRPDGGPEFSAALTREFHASMVAVSAAAHTVDAF